MLFAKLPVRVRLRDSPQPCDHIRRSLPSRALAHRLAPPSTGPPEQSGPTPAAARHCCAARKYARTATSTSSPGSPRPRAPLPPVECFEPSTAEACVLYETLDNAGFASGVAGAQWAHSQVGTRRPLRRGRAASVGRPHPCSRSGVLLADPPARGVGRLERVIRKAPSDTASHHRASGRVNQPLAPWCEVAGTGIRNTNDPLRPIFSRRRWKTTSGPSAGGPHKHPHQLGTGEPTLGSSGDEHC